MMNTLIILELEDFSSDSSLGDDLDLNTVSGVDIALGGDHKYIFND